MASPVLHKRVVLLIGRTGQGKSTVANVLTESHLFKESADAVSETKDHQVERVVDGDTEFTVVDTIGIGDTKLTLQEVLNKIADAAYAVRNGLHQVFFVTSGRFTAEEVQAWQILTDVIFSPEVSRYTTVVRTRFPKFRDSQACEVDRAKIRAENSELAGIMQSANKMIYVNNLTEDEEPSQASRRESRLRLLTSLRAAQELYKPHNLDDLAERIKSHETEKEKQQKALDEVMKKIEAADAKNKELLASLEAERKNHVAALEAAKKAIAEKTGGVLQEKAPGVWEVLAKGIGAALGAAVTKCSIQ